MAHLTPETRVNAQRAAEELVRNKQTFAPIPEQPTLFVTTQKDTDFVVIEKTIVGEVEVYIGHKTR